MLTTEKAVPQDEELLDRSEAKAKREASPPQ
jgi:hypothetical protein